MIPRGQTAGQRRGGATVVDALRKALDLLQQRADPADAETVPLVRRALEDVQALLHERDRLRVLVVEFLKAYEAPEEEQRALRRRARDEIATG